VAEAAAADTDRIRAGTTRTGDFLFFTNRPGERRTVAGNRSICTAAGVESICPCFVSTFLDIKTAIYYSDKRARIEGVC
jgi:hypothetical protein